MKSCSGPFVNEILRASTLESHCEALNQGNCLPLESEISLQVGIWFCRFLVMLNSNIDTGTLKETSFYMYRRAELGRHTAVINRINLH